MVSRGLQLSCLVRGLLLVSAFCVLSRIAMAERFSFFHEHVLGTSLEIEIEATDFPAAQAAEARVLDEIQRLAKIFSSYDASSEFSRWQETHGRPESISPELFEVLAASASWQERSRGAFNPAVEQLSRLWKAHETQPSPPTAEELAPVVADLQQSHWRLDSSTAKATRLARGALSLNAIAKGEILDRATAIASQSPGVLGALVCLGGDLRVAGDLVQPVHVVDPHNDAVNATAVTTVHLHDRALATSGDYRRRFQIAGKWYSHIFDPRTGQPVNHIASATVIANTARDADALATIFSILSPTETADLAANCPDIEYLLITREGQRLASPGWHDFEQPQLFRFAAATQDQLAQADTTPAAPASPSPAKSELLELLVKFELASPTGSQYRRPYVAVWLEDADEFPVRTAVLWMQTKQPGPRWHRDLLRWYRNDAVRKLADKRDLIGTISGATRGSGQYKAVFDGKDDAGQLLPAGKYTLFIEVAREHGTYQLIRHPLTLGTEPIAETKLKSNVEIQSASVEYRPATADKPAEK